MKKILLDAHTHTVASGHAYSSLQEMAKAAADKGLEVLGITEHGPSVPGTCPTLYFKNMFVVPRQMYGIRLLMGCEINILDTKGSLDLTDEQIGWLDLAIAGIHAAWYKAGTKEENTEGLVNVIRNPKIHMISHPGDGSCELDFEPLVLAAKEAHTLLEVNNHSLAPQRHKTVARDNNLEILRLCTHLVPDSRLRAALPSPGRNRLPRRADHELPARQVFRVFRDSEVIGSRSSDSPDGLFYL